MNQKIITRVSQLSGMKKKDVADYLLHLHEVEHCKLAEFWESSSYFGFSVLSTEDNYEAIENEIQRVIRRFSLRVGKRFEVSYKRNFDAFAISFF
jgi:hypothetical protein